MISRKRFHRSHVAEMWFENKKYDWKLNFLTWFYFQFSKISISYLYYCQLNIIFRFLYPQNITLDTRTIKIFNMDQKIWNKVNSFIFGGGHCENIQYGWHQELIALGTPSKIVYYDHSAHKKIWHFCLPCKYLAPFYPKAPSDAGNVENLAFFQFLYFSFTQ